MSVDNNTLASPDAFPMRGLQDTNPVKARPSMLLSIPLLMLLQCIDIIFPKVERIENLGAQLGAPI